MSTVTKAAWTALILAVITGLLVLNWDTSDRGTLIAITATVVFALAAYWSPSMGLAVLTVVALAVTLAMMLLGWAWNLGWWMAPLLALVWIVAGRPLRDQSVG